MSILVDAEVALIEIGDDVLLIVEYGGMQQDFLDLLAKNEGAVVGRVARRGCGRTR